jgi:hypothetical protein
MYYIVAPLLRKRRGAVCQRYATGNPVTPSMQSRVIISSAVRDLRLRLLVREKRAVQVMFPRVRIPQYQQQFDPLQTKGYGFCHEGP